MRAWKKEMSYVVAVGTVFAVLTFVTWCKPAEEISQTERRKLAEFPDIRTQSIQNGLFMKQLESYMVDQFPFREEFRKWKSIWAKELLGQKDQNGIYMEAGVLGKLDNRYEPEAVERATQKYARIYERYIKGSEANIYTALIPDKNYFMAEKNGYPAMDYETLYLEYQEKMSGLASYIEIKEALELEDYYRTDTHWRQEKIQKVARHLAEEMGTHLSRTYEEVTLDVPFYGVYYGQAALSVEPDSISYMDQALFQKCRVYDYQNQKEIPVYDVAAAKGRDAYELFLGGTCSVLTIENPQAKTEKELVIFRDSFGSSIAPYFVESYRKITLLDARYLQESLIPKYVTFTDQDVLILHSISVINNKDAF